MKTALITCRTGMGSSMMLKIKVDQVVKENKFDLKVLHDELSAVRTFKGDLLIAMADLAQELEGKGKYVIGINNLMDKEEIKEKLEKFFDEVK